MPLSLRVGNTNIPYEERRSTRAKRISIRVTSEKVKVSAPLQVSKREIEAFINKNQQWILESWIKLQESVKKAPIRSFQTGSSVRYLGKDLEIRIEKSPQKMVKAHYEKESQSLSIEIPLSVDEVQKQEIIRMILKKWFQQRARNLFHQKLDSWSKMMGVNYNEFRLKEQKTRWGSCSSLGNINLNWRVVMAPEPIIDYLVIHELAHLKHLNHSQEFWKEVAKFCPEYSKLKKWLRENGKELIL